MSWSKLKNIIILILLLLNLFLLALVGVNRIRSDRYRATALSEAAAVLEANGIQVPDILPSDMELSSAVSARDLEREEQLAAALLGEDARAEAAGGGLYVYESDIGRASFRSNGELTVEFTAPALFDDGVEHAAHVRQLLERLDLRVWQVDESGDTVTVLQSVNGAPVFSSGVASSSASPVGVSFSFDGDGRLLRVSGRLLLGQAQADPDGEPPLSVPTALIGFFGFIVENGDVCQAIREMQPAYRVSALTDPVRLTPVWRITTDTGDYVVDACTGEITRAAAE